MEVTTRRFEPETDYDMIKEWWIAHGSHVMPLRHLSKHGIIVEVDGEGVCAAFMFQTDSAICIFEFMVCNPASPKEARDVGLDRMIKEAIFWAEVNGYELIYTSTGINKFVSRLVDNGFMNIDNNQSHCFKFMEIEKCQKV